MARARVSVNISDAAVRGLVGPKGPVARAVRQVAGRVRDNARRNLTARGHVDTGRLRNDVDYRVTSRLGRISAVVGTNLDYGRFIHEGTSGPIRPRRAKVLRFSPKGTSAVIFRPQVSGIEADPWLTDALEDTSVGDVLG